MDIGIIGHGRIGKLLSNYLSRDFDVYVYDKSKSQIDQKNTRYQFSTLDEICNKRIILPLVPISDFEETIETIKTKINKNAIVIDACSVKEFPIKIMLQKLPKSVSIIGSHPMFGPDSVKDTLFGAKIVLCKTRINDHLFNDIKNYLQNYGVRVIETSAENHDREISQSLVLTHFIGRSLVEFESHDLMIDTKGYRRLMKILETVINDSWQLFEDMNKYNQFAKSTRNDFLTAMNNISKKLDQ